MWYQNDKLWSIYIYICNNAEWGEAGKFLRMISMPHEKRKAVKKPLKRNIS